LGNWQDAVRYRNRAELLRTIADETPHDDQQEALRRVAEYYEKMAASLDDKARNQDR
jgi:hypothetical protein